MNINEAQKKAEELYGPHAIVEAPPIPSPRYVLMIGNDDGNPCHTLGEGDTIDEMFEDALINWEGEEFEDVRANSEEAARRLTRLAATPTMRREVVRYQCMVIGSYAASISALLDLQDHGDASGVSSGERVAELARMIGYAATAIEASAQAEVEK